MLESFDYYLQYCLRVKHSNSDALYHDPCNHSARHPNTKVHSARPIVIRQQKRPHTLRDTPTSNQLSSMESTKPPKGSPRGQP